MSETPASYLSSAEEPVIRNCALTLATRLLSKLQVGQNHKPGTPVEVVLRMSVGVDADSAVGGVRASGRMDAEHQCHLAGFGPYREKTEATAEVPA